MYFSRLSSQNWMPGQAETRDIPSPFEAHDFARHSVEDINHTHPFSPVFSYPIFFPTCKNLILGSDGDVCSLPFSLQRFAVVIREGGSEATATIPCTARNQFNDKFILKFKANGHRYNADLYRGHEVTFIGGDGWAEFRLECDVQHGQVVVFIMEGRMPKAYITQDFGVLEGGEEGEGAEGEEEGEAAEEVEVMDEEDDDHEAGAASNFDNTIGFVFEADEYATMEALLANEDEYLGPHFAHRLTPTNVIKKLMKIPRKMVQPMNLEEGVIGLCMGAGDVMEVAYRMDKHGRMVFNKQWGVFVAQNHLEVNNAVAFNFRENNAQGVDLVCVVNPLRPAGP